MYNNCCSKSVVSSVQRKEREAAEHVGVQRLLMYVHLILELLQMLPNGAVMKEEYEIFAYEYDLFY